MRPSEHEARSAAALLIASFASHGAVAMTTIVAGKQVFDLTHSPLALGLLGLAEFAPAALLVFVTGTVADRNPRRLVAAAGFGAATLTLAVLAAYSAGEPSAVLPIFGMMILFGTARAFAEPAIRSLPADSVAPEHLPRLSARVAFTRQAGMITGPVVGGLLYGAGLGLTYGVAAVSMLVGAIVVTLVKARPVRLEAADTTKASRPTLHEAREGARFVRSQPILLGAISLDLFAVLFGGAVALLPAIAEDRLGVGAVGLGWLRAAIGIGSAAVTLVLMARPITRRVGRVLLFVVAIFGAGTVVLGLTTSFAVAFVALVVASGADSISVFIRTTLVPLVTPAPMRGRVLALESVFIGASNELGAFESGVVGQLIGPAAAVGLGGVATLVIAAVWWVWFPRLREVDRFPTPEADPPGEREGNQPTP